eukprot:SAG11_NODE_6711_length_1261_cov_1.925990_3_plen_136_part_00
MATELGFQSRPRSYFAPGGSARFNPGDCSVYMKCYHMEDQRLAYAAFYGAFSTATESDASWFAGVLWWMWRSDPSSGGFSDLTFTPRGKPAAAEMKQFARRQGAPLTKFLPSVFFFHSVGLVGWTRGRSWHGRLS